MSNSNDCPNVLILLSDQHSKFNLGCYGDSIVRTPNIDRIAAEGMRFDNAYCASPLCVPSRMSFMTSRTPSSIKVWKNNHILHSAIPTWAHTLGAAGYETSLIGRMHFVGPDQRHGFERRPMGEYSARYPGTKDTNTKRFVQLPQSTVRQTRDSVEIAGHGRTVRQAFDEVVADKTCAYLKEKAGEGDGRPFAAVGGFILPHCPFFAPKELFDYYYDRVDVPELTEAQIQREPKPVRDFRNSRGIEEPLSTEQIRVARAAYFGLCEYLDQQIGKVLNTLDATGLSENTLVIYGSDHGEMAGEHGLWWKSNYFEGSVGIPMIARLPGVIERDSVNNTICNLIDIGPTLSDMAGAEIPERTDGHSLWGELTGDPKNPHPDKTFSEHFGGYNEQPSRMIRSGPWKLYHYYGDEHPVLFNLEEDPNEWFDLAQDPDPRLIEIRKKLFTQLYQEWNPEYVLKESEILDHDFQTLCQWGAEVNPPHPDTHPIPDATEVTRV
jgi:choline-sulfatase